MTNNFSFADQHSHGENYTLLHKPDGQDTIALYIYELTNGLTVYLTKNREKPRFYAEVIVRAGSKHDYPEATGLAHYLEHLMFKGTKKFGTTNYQKEKVHLDRITELYEKHFVETDGEKRKEIYAEINRESQLAAKFAITGEYDRLYSSMGGTSLNAYTWHEKTAYQVELPSNRIQQWAELEAERFFEPVFRLFQTELEVVYEEKNRTLDNKDRLIYNAVMAQLYKTHPYGQQPTIGKTEHLKSPSIARISKFYKSYYVPNNMAIIISGDIDIDRTINIIAKEFSKWKRGELSVPEFPEEKPIVGVERIEVKYPGEEQVMIAFRTAAKNHEDVPALKLIDMILDNSVAGLININLNQRQKVRQAGSAPYIYNDYGSQTLWGIPKSGQSLEDVERLLIAQLEKIKNGEFEDWILDAVVTDFKKTQKKKLESNRGRAGIFREAFLAYQNWYHAIAELEVMGKISREQLIEVANRYFGSNYVVGYRRDGEHKVPSIEKPQIDKLQGSADGQSAFAERILSQQIKPIEPIFVSPEDYQIVENSNGTNIYYVKNPINDLFTFSITIDVGSRQNNRLPIVAQLLDKSGTTELTPGEVKKEWYKLGSDFKLKVKDQETTIQLAGLDENFRSSVMLAVKLLIDPNSSEETLEKLISIISANRRDARKNYRVVSNALIHYNRYGKKSRYLEMLPNDELQKLTVSELKSELTKLLSFRRKINYTGSLPIDEVMEVLEANGLIDSKLIEPPPHHFLKVRSPEKTEIYLLEKKMAQSQVRIEFGGESYDDSEKPSIELYNEYFSGGMSGIVFQELREARALAYVAWGHYFLGTRKGEQNVMAGKIGCQGDKTAEAVGAFIDLMDNLPNMPEHFKSAQNSVINRYRTGKIGFRHLLSNVQRWEKLGFHSDPRRKYFAELLHSELDFVLKFHAENIRNRPKLISIVGNMEQIDRDTLRKNGKIVEVELDSILAF